MSGNRNPDLQWMLGIVTRRPLVLQLHKTEDGQAEYGEFLHAPDLGERVVCYLIWFLVILPVVA